MIAHLDAPNSMPCDRRDGTLTEPMDRAAL